MAKKEQKEGKTQHSVKSEEQKLDRSAMGKICFVLPGMKRSKPDTCPDFTSDHDITPPAKCIRKKK